MEVEPGNNIVRAKRSKHIPVVFTKEEAGLIISNLKGAYWLISNLLYGSGLRLLECLKLRVKDIDIDFNYNQIIVRDGKGEKDRITILPISIQEQLKDQFRSVALTGKGFFRHQQDILQRKTLKEDTIYMKAQFREKLKKPYSTQKF